MDKVEAYQQLETHVQMTVKGCMDHFIEHLNEFARLMEQGDILMMSGPDAIRLFAASLNQVLIA